MAPRSSRNNFIEPPSVVERLYEGLPQGLIAQLQRQAGDGFITPRGLPSVLEHLKRLRRRFRWNWKAVFNLPHALILLWLLVLWWGERTVFRKTVEACEWGKWERWVCYAV